MSRGESTQGEPLAGKLTGMLLEMDDNELLLLLDDAVALGTKVRAVPASGGGAGARAHSPLPRLQVQEALALLRAHGAA